MGCWQRTEKSKSSTMDPSDFSGSASFVDEATLEAAKQDPSTTVYEWQETKVKPLPMEEVREIINESRQLFYKHRREHPDWNDARIQEEIKGYSERIAKFGNETHQRIFKLVVNRDTTEAVFDVIAQGIAIRTKAEQGEMDDEEVKVRMSAAVLEHARKKSEKRGK